MLYTNVCKYFRVLLHPPQKILNSYWSNIMEKPKLNYEIIKKHRMSKGWSAQHLAEVSGLHLTTVQRIENGKGWSLDSLQAISSATEIEIEDMLCVETDSESPSVTGGYKRHNPFKYLYQWIQSLKDEGYSLKEILSAFETNPTTIMDKQNHEEVSLASVIIRHALGQIPDSEIAPYCHPTRVLDFEPVKELSEGFLFLAITPENEENIHFLVDRNVLEVPDSITKIQTFLNIKRSDSCDLILKKIHTSNPWEISDSEVKVASAKLTWRDFKLY